MPTTNPSPPKPRVYPNAKLSPAQMIAEMREYGLRLDRPDKLPEPLIEKLHRLCREHLERTEDPHGLPRQFAERIARCSKTLSETSIPRRAALLAQTDLGRCVLQGRKYLRPGT